MPLIFATMYLAIVSTNLLAVVRASGVLQHLWGSPIYSTSSQYILRISAEQIQEIEGSHPDAFAESGIYQASQSALYHNCTNSW